MRMIASNKFGDKRILVVDKEPKAKNDRTWCFWEKQPGFFEEIVYRKWDKLWFLSEDYSARMEISPYQYKMIRGIDFYDHCLATIQQQDNIEMVYGNVGEWKCEKEATMLQIDNKLFRFQDNNTFLFNSIYRPAETTKGSLRLLQHFKGWLIHTPGPSFITGEATMMDFRVHQRHGTTFAYVLPICPHTALVEYTLFTKELLKPGQYDEELRDYIKSFLHIENYTICDQEFGVIPMTNEKTRFCDNGWQIGTAGGQTKASSGYTFQFIQKQSDQILRQLLEGRSLNDLPQTQRRFHFYDHTLLHILYHNTLPGKEIFSRLFEKNKPQQVLKFLDNESSLADELSIISSLPTFPFLKAALRQLF